jgi:hypothetical protein
MIPAAVLANIVGTYDNVEGGASGMMSLDRSSIEIWLLEK